MADYQNLSYFGKVSGSKVRSTALAGVLSLALAVVGFVLPAFAHAALPAGFEDNPTITGLTQPVGVEWAANGRAFIAEKHGVVKTAAPGASTATTVLDIKGLVNDSGDNGLETVAVDSSFATNGYVYVAYTAETLISDAATPTVSRLVRYTLNPATGQLAAGGGSPTILLGTHNGPCPTPANDVDCMPAESGSHMIGTVRSEPDGTLWVGHGDGAGFNGVDVAALRSLDPKSLAGKILHVDREGRAVPGPHPFCAAGASLNDVCAKVHAKGFRNPFRFHVRPDKKIILGDVGWNTREEIDVVDGPGRSYGWPCREGKIATPGYQDLEACAPYTTSTETDPIYDYPRCQGNSPPSAVCGSAVIGGPDYQGDEYPAGYRGSMFVGDYTGYKIFRLPPDGNGGYGPPQVFDDAWLGTDLEPTPAGNLAYVNFGYGTGPDGYVGTISYSAGNRTPAVSATANKTSGPAPLAVAFDGSGSSDPDGDPLTYDWDFGDGSAHSSAINPSHTYTRPGTFQAKLTVSDGRGKSASKTIAITAGGTAPVATIAAPTAGYEYRDGDPVQLSGSATDPDDGSLPTSALSWQVILHHGAHVHFHSSFPGVSQATFTTGRDHDADSYYEIRLTATDSQGLTNTKTVEIQPETTTATIASTPTGAPVSYGGRNATAPFSATTAIGYSTTATAAAAFASGGRPFVFDRWSDGTTGNTRNLTVPETGVDLHARYVEDKSRGMIATASSTQEGNTALYGPGRAVDGVATTRWSSDRLGDQWWQVDLGKRRSVDRVQVDWEDAYASRYQIQTSLNGTSWDTAAETTQSAAGSRTTAFSSRAARYVRVLGVTRGSQYGMSFYEARVLGPPDDTQAPDTTITSGPSEEVEATSASFGFSSNEAGSTFECKLDGGSWEPCSNPKGYSSLALGAHTFSVRASDQTGNVDPSPATRAFTLVDRTAPDTTITLGPNGTIGQTSATFNFTSGELGVTFECKLDAGAWAACTSPKPVTNLGEGSHTFSVRAVDAANNADSTPDSNTFAVDRTGPVTVIDGGPTGTIKVKTASLTFSSEAGATFECSLDNGTAYTACSSPETFSGLGEGTHTIRVRGTDRYGNLGAAASRAFAVDTIAPDTTLDSEPAALIKTTSASFGFSSPEAGMSFQCRVDQAAYAGCTSPKAYTSLTEGAHRFEVRAVDAAGNTDASPAGHDFTVDTSAPQTTIVSSPPALIGTSTASYTFSSEPGATFRCKLDGGSYASCASPKDLTGLSDGLHTFSVEATDAAGNADASPATHTFTVDTNRPETTIDSGPSGTITAASADFTFSGQRQTRFECRLDTGAWAPCASPKALTGLADGAHSFTVRGVSAAGNPDPTPAERAFTVDTRPPASPVTPSVPSTPAPSPAPAETPSSTTTPKPKAKPTYASTVLGTRGLKAMYGLGDAGRSAVDAKGGRSGRFHGSPKRAKKLARSGRDELARAFDGRDDRVELDPHVLGTPATFSVETWVQARRGAILSVLTDRLRDGFELAVNSNGRLVVDTVGEDIATELTGPVLGTGRHHVAATYDGRRMRLYVDGRLRSSIRPRDRIRWSRKRRATVGVGADGDNPLKGTLDELALYDRALAASTVKAHYSTGR